MLLLIFLLFISAFVSVVQSKDHFLNSNISLSIRQAANAGCPCKCQLNAKKRSPLCLNTPQGLCKVTKCKFVSTKAFQCCFKGKPLSLTESNKKKRCTSTRNLHEVLQVSGKRLRKNQVNRVREHPLYRC